MNRTCVAIIDTGLDCGLQKGNPFEGGIGIDLIPNQRYRSCIIADVSDHHGHGTEVASLLAALSPM
jgi:hypothetical protein